MKTLITLGLVGAIVVVSFLWVTFINQKKEPSTNNVRPLDEKLPKQKVQNDRLVISTNITFEEINKILTGFCNMYNEKTYKALPRLYKINERQFAITFPYDIEFSIFCFFVNYVHYPMGFKKSFEVTGWTTTKKGESWITEKITSKRVMLFIPYDDTEYDNVYLTTEDNIGYKLGFALGHEKQLLDFPKLNFVKPQIEIEELVEKDYTDYK